MNRLKFIFFLICFYIPFSGFSQDLKQLTLREVVELAQSQSPAAKLASTQLKNSYWVYRNFKANYLPQLVLNGNVPDYNSSISSIIQNDGTERFRRRSLSNSSLDLSLNQNIGLTGGSVFVSSQIQRIDIFTTPRSVSYLANPAIIGFRQPLFTFNAFRWDNKIEPLRFEESKRQYNEELENISIKATEFFFNLLIAQIQHKIELKNVANTDTLYKISLGRYNLGKIAENDLLQMQLSLMNAKNNLSQAELDVDLGELQLKTFLKMSEKEKIVLIEPPLIPEFEVNEQKALEQAKKNRQQVITFERERLEAERNVARARGENSLNVDMFASYGLTQSAAVVPDLYINPQDQQRLNIAFQLPILDWGRSKSQVRTALANRDLVLTEIEQSEQNFQQDIMLLSKQFKMYRQRLLIASKSDTIAQKRYDITVKRYMIGKIGIIDLNIALQEKDEAKLAYFEALRAFWNGYFQLRRKTLYDFELQKEISR